MAQTGYTTDSFSNHPSNISSATILVSRGVEERAPTAENLRRPATTTTPQRIVLKIQHASPYSEQRPTTRDQRPKTEFFGSQTNSYLPPNTQPFIYQQTMPPTQMPVNGTVSAGGNMYTNSGHAKVQEETTDFTCESNPRYQTFYHLKAIFCEEKVRETMERLPNENDRKKLCKELMQLQL